MYDENMNKVKARTIAGKNHSGPTSPLYNYYRKGELDFHGILHEINDALSFVRNSKTRKELTELETYIRNHK